MIKEFKLMLDIKPDDFCESDLIDAIKDGLDNIGNYTLISISQCEVLK